MPRITAEQRNFPNLSLATPQQSPSRNTAAIFFSQHRRNLTLAITQQFPSRNTAAIFFSPHRRNLTLAITQQFPSRNSAAIFFSQHRSNGVYLLLATTSNFPLATAQQFSSQNSAAIFFSQHRSNFPLPTPQQYYKRAVSLFFLLMLCYRSQNQIFFSQCQRLLFLV